MSDQNQSILLDAPREVDIAQIERELTKIWKQAASDANGEKNPVVRACSHNLVIFTEGNDRFGGLEEIVSQVTVDHPSRIFLVSVDRRTATPTIDAWVSARCSLPVPGGKQVCCEEINLNAGGTDANKIPSIITSLLLPDIPTFLVWKARLDGRDNILAELVQLADRVLIDSSEELRPAESLVSWGKFISERRGRIAFGDLAWTHLVQWRSFLAQTFQPVEIRSQLPSIDAVTIEYSSTTTPLHSGLSQSLLAVGWLAHALRLVLIHPFKEVKDGEYDAKFRLGEQAINIRLNPGPSRSNCPGGIESIVIHSANGGQVGYNMLPKEGGILQRLSLSGLPPSETVLSIHLQAEAELVSRELDILYHDPLYESTVAVLTTLLSDDSR